MEALRQQRTPLRSAFTRTANSLDQELKSTSPDADTLVSLLDLLEDKGAKLAQLDKGILDLLQEGRCSQEDFNREYEAAEIYNDRLVSVRSITKRLLARLDDDTRSRTSQASAVLVENGQRKFRLPEIELKRFSGELRDWLGFWGQFKKIDSDPEIALEDKYQYLLQATVPKSKAREIVESFPPTGENYRKALEHLKSRFGKEDTLVEVYVRDLLKLVLNNALNQKERIVLSTLYDKLETQLRALETLNVTSDKYASMLYPLVESSLPEEILRAWERNRGLVTRARIEGADDTTTPNQLKLLMSFLRSEVDGEERIRMARTGFGLEINNKKWNSSKPTETQDSFPTAAGLFSGSQGDVNKCLSCIFCEKKHLSQDCRSVKQMTLEQKRQLLVQKNGCFLCLKRGHISRMCTGKQRCSACQKRHFAVMCPKLFENPAPEPKFLHQQGKSFPNQEGINDRHSTDNALANQSCTSEVKLQTLKVFVRGKNGKHVVRALIDSGSQKSYLTERLAKEMGYSALGEEKMVHSLFGGTETSEQRHRKYRIYLTSLSGDYNCNFEALDQPTICGSIPEVKGGSWMKELSRHGITLSDRVSIANQYTESENDIQVLIGADVAGKLLTGRVQALQCGPVAVETRLGWTLMGKMASKPNSPDNTMSVISLLVRDSSVSELWRLDNIGISDLSENLTKKEIRQITPSDAWRHIPGSKNPADLPSRGCSVPQLLASKWWEGPDWLQLTPDFWPRSEFSVNETLVCEEIKKSTVSSVNSDRERGWYCKGLSSFSRIVRMLAWILGFLSNARKTVLERIGGKLTLKEVQEAEMVLLKIVQMEAFDGPHDKSLSDFQPFTDANGVIRVKTRLDARDDTDLFRFPIVLPSNHSVINSRPITYLFDDVRDVLPLSPKMILQEVTNIGISDLDTLGHSGLNKRLRYIQNLRENLRKRFRLEYLGQLRHTKLRELPIPLQ